VVAAGGLLVEAAALGVVAVAAVVSLVRNGSSDLAVALALVAVALGTGALLVVGARALRRGARRARGPVVTWQLLQAATALAILQVPGRAAVAAAGAALAVVLAVVVTVALLTPAAVAHQR